MAGIPDHIQRLCDEFSIEIIGKSRYPIPGQTRAVETLARIYRRFGEVHLRMVLTTMRETANNHALLDEVGLWMASDMVRVRGESNINSDWLALWDVMDVGPLQALAQDLAGIIPVRYALGGMIYERVHRRFGPKQLDLLDDRRPL